MRFLLLWLVFTYVNANLFGQAIYTEKDVEICESKFEFAASENLALKPIEDIIVEIGKAFLGLDYEAHTLESGDEEKLVIHLTGLDCYTFFESSLVFARCIKKGEASFEDFKRELARVRYRNGEMNEYPSRLHYASDWLYDNDRRGIVSDITKDIGGTPYKKIIDFMSKHPESYKSLKNNPDFVKKIAEVESKITKREKYYIPQDQIEKIESKIKNGDIILITSDVKGLDISHTGIAVRMRNGRIHFMHAPLEGKKVQITKETLADYIKKLERHTGLMIARPLEP